MRTSRMLGSLLLLCSILATCTTPGLVGATKDRPGYVPPEVGDWDGGKKFCDRTTSVPLPSYIWDFINWMAAGKCQDALDRLDAQFVVAYKQAESEGVSPGLPVNLIHLWGDVHIQDFIHGSWGNGEGAIFRTLKVKESRPFYVGGGNWRAFKTAAANGRFPGYPVNTEHQWNKVKIQDFRGGTWGDGATIGGSKAWYVGGGAWKAYIRADGSNRLRNPLGLTTRSSSGLWTQQFEGGQIFERSGGGQKVYFYDTKKSICYNGCP